MRKLPLVPLLLLAGCGFHPLYGPQAGQSTPVAAQMDQIDIGLIPDRQGQLLRQALERDLQRGDAPSFYRYHLTVSYGLSVQIIGIQPDSSNTRDRYIASAHWVLTPEGATPAGTKGAAIAQGNAQAMDATNIIDNQYFAASLDADTMRHQLAREVATQISTQLALYFRSHPAAR